jgi:hypothetical protein
VIPPGPGRNRAGGGSVTVWRWDFGDLVEVDDAESESLPWLGLRATDGSLVLEPVQVEALPSP